MPIQKWLILVIVFIGGLLLGLGASIVIDRISTESQDALTLGEILGGLAILLLILAIPIVYLVPIAIGTLQSTRPMERVQEAEFHTPVGMPRIQRVLIPFGGGPHARLGLQLAAKIAGDGKSLLTLLRVIPPSDDVDVKSEVEKLHRIADEILGPDHAVQAQVVVSHSAVSAILEEAGRGYDLLIFGESEEGEPRKWLSSAISERIIERAPCSVLIVHSQVEELQAEEA